MGARRDRAPSTFDFRGIYFARLCKNGKGCGIEGTIFQETPADTRFAEFA
jgi:hypothetical protein